ncbi:hypothetical protein CHU92_14205 [Flavobacterium cyanobacteriorum]|uniref:OmpA-like domain-containing protein n=1 Tax=Flavobacterium cyanobacteriorum TaxID=2022802 RepID=A0A255YSP0_9FLAO|nr:OmpA family protein [Flavobacterium cyanobacteriorum]OYQ32237.1 hypothetical protein CHU92_14205 [Flavobacterium cyanobacteriorum]
MKNLLLLLLLLPLTASTQEKFIVYFDFDVAEANPSSAKDLKLWIDANKNAEVLQIDGYADAVGTDAYNKELSEKRAAYVYRLLRAEGLDVTGIRQQGFGESVARGGKSPQDRKVTVVIKKLQVEKASVAPKPETKLFGAVSTAKKGDKLRLSNLNFYDKSDVVLPQCEPVLRELLAIMQANPNLKIDIQGHICCQEIDVLDVANKRAKAVHRFLELNGIAGNRISYQSFGSNRPLYKIPEKNEEERVANRRVEIEILEID